MCLAKGKKGTGLGEAEGEDQTFAQRDVLEKRADDQKTEGAFGAALGREVVAPNADGIQIREAEVKVEGLEVAVQLHPFDLLAEPGNPS